MNGPLDGMKVLVVEDEYLVAMLIQEMLEDAGCTVVGPVPRLKEALNAAVCESCDAAVLDVNLAGERIGPVADMLSRRDIPFVLVTGYSLDHLPGAYAERPHVRKPFKAADLVGAVASVVSSDSAC